MATLQVNAGRAVLTAQFILKNLFGGWGTGAGTTTATATALFTEDNTSGYHRVTATMSQVTTTTSGDTVQAVWTQTALGSLTITNAGLFDTIVTNTGNLWVMGDFGGIALATNDAIQFTAKCPYT